MPGLYGAIVSFFSPALFSVIISLAWPSRFDWREFLRIDLIEDKSPANSSLQSKVPSSEAIHDQLTTDIGSEKKAYPTADESVSLQSPTQVQKNAQIPLDQVFHPFDQRTIKHIKKWIKIASTYFVINVLVTIVLWPLPLYRNYIFTKTFFSGWVTVAIIWHFGAIAAVIVYPVYDGRHEIARAIRGIAKDLKRGNKVKH
jgi:hypothetical protein